MNDRRKTRDDDSARSDLQVARRAHPVSTDTLNLPDVPEASLSRLNTRKPEKVGYELNPRLVTHLSLSFLRERSIDARGPLSLDEAMVLLERQHPRWAKVLSLRVSEDLSQAAVAKRVNTHQSTVSRYERDALAFLTRHTAQAVEMHAIAEVSARKLN